MQALADALAAALTAVLPLATALAGWAAGKLGRGRRADKALTEGVKSLLRGQIIDLGLHYIRAGEIPPYGLDTLENYYAAYVDLGDGDRSTHDILDRCRRLPIRGGGD
ncbi:MAG: hypothetical protein DBX91_01070 [Subdoligranulum variabile]|nr:MAG: hypothetical protein DBX91_01070 [Subdoligranulum variabile]